jgi:hypothetical protein
MKRAALTALVLTTLAFGSSLAQSELKPGQKYEGGVRVQASFLGISMMIPKGWVAKYGSDAANAALVMGSTTIEGVGLAILVGNQSAQQVVSSLNEAQDLGGGVVLEPTGAAKQQNQRITARYTNTEYVGRALGLIGPGKNHVVYFFAGPQKNEKIYAGLLEDLATGTKFITPNASKPQPTAPAASTGLTQDWTKFLSGMMLRYLSSYNSGGGGGGMSTDRTMHFCSDGSFAYLSSSLTTINVDGGGASSGGQDRAQGRWHVESATQTSAVVILSLENGSTERITVGYDGTKTFVDGQRWFRVESDACQ